LFGLPTDFDLPDALTIAGRRNHQTLRVCVGRFERVANVRRKNPSFVRWITSDFQPMSGRGFCQFAARFNVVLRWAANPCLECRKILRIENKSGPGVANAPDSVVMTLHFP
jgi:hypothetical protein